MEHRYMVSVTVLYSKSVIVLDLGTVSHSL